MSVARMSSMMLDRVTTSRSCSSCAPTSQVWVSQHKPCSFCCNWVSCLCYILTPNCPGRCKPVGQAHTLLWFSEGNKLQGSGRYGMSMEGTPVSAIVCHFAAMAAQIVRSFSNSSASRQRSTGTFVYRVIEVSYASKQPKEVSPVLPLG